MSSIKYINPEGVEVEVPQADAAWFDEQGWPRAEEGGTKKKKKDTTNNE